jgi:hypothetical protein
MTLRETIQMLSEGIDDIPAVTKHVYYTNMEDLYNLLRKGISAASVTRKTGKIPEGTKAGMGKTFGRNYNGVKVELFTDRIKTGVRGASVKPTATKYRVARVDAEILVPYFKQTWGIDVPEKFLKDAEHNYVDEKAVVDFVKSNKKIFNTNAKKRRVISDLALVSLAAKMAGDAAMDRDSEEKIETSKPIPADPKFMKVTIETAPREMDIDFLHRLKNNEDLTRSFLEAIQKHEDVFVKNGNLTKLKSLLESSLF